MRVLLDKEQGGKLNTILYAQIFFKRCDESVIRDNFAVKFRAANKDERDFLGLSTIVEVSGAGCFAEFSAKDCYLENAPDIETLRTFLCSATFYIATEQLKNAFTITQSELTAEEKQHFENYVAACNALGLEQNYGELVAITIELKGEL